MSFYKLYNFLRDLQKNNSKDWMDENRSQYLEVRNWYIQWLDELNTELVKVDKGYHDTPGRKAINRINNNLMFHPNKPVYKDHFGAGMDLAANGKQGDFYIHLGTRESFIAGGFYKPKKEILSSLRDAIDYNGADYKKILNKKSFKDTFHIINDGDSLKTAPKGYSQDHEHIDLLRLKTFAVQHDLTQNEVQADDFKAKCIEVYKELKPFRAYLNKAVTV
ncbi:DUF2461 domain-containing protein [Nonlabens ulvanivorans]|uniref:DUF2461 domain-containing protein n=1 Tax=Nonlabens ulvanivorans TaxID=906888 RepID=UPI0029433002|nr:DUF2461 domain-containing protein [Nonlabens ulvanivorans]WOI22133.1 DUF2461 domain-containing protein [Nonlabens ulvanivorans]